MKSKGYFHVGRESSSNSIVADIISITDVDSVELDLYFERFINPFRASTPDFDIDFYREDRNNVTNFVFKRFKNTALLATYNTFKYKTVIDEQEKCLDYPKKKLTN
jgi:DNA polymerase-3 subunit alpha